MIEEEIVFNTCKEIYDSNTIRVGMCIHITALLVKYFQAKNIETKVHFVFLSNPNTKEKMIKHNWISHNNKRCDITADKQLEGFKTQVIILDEEISEKYSSDVEIISLAKKPFNHTRVSSDEKEYLEYKMLLQALESEDSSFSNVLIDEYIKQQNENYQHSVKNLKVDSTVLDVIEIIKKEVENF
jgi:hypothetical protein